MVTDPRQNPSTPLKCLFWISARDFEHLAKEEQGHQCGEKAEWACGDELRYCHSHGQEIVRATPLEVARELKLRLITP
jgi:hypothetical protein